MSRIYLEHKPGVFVRASGPEIGEYAAHLALVRHFKRRAALLCRCHAEYMMQAERWFITWRQDLTGGPEHERHWKNYQRVSDKAARMFARHSRLMVRILGGAS